MKIARAILSVSDKTGLIPFARVLHSLGIQLLSTGGTARALRADGLPVTEVADVTGFPEIMDGRVKTLHPKIHGGILGRRGVDDAVMDDHAIEPIDLVVINLYPFVETIRAENVTWEDAVENIDIGGPAMLRAAAKNHDHVAVVVKPARYEALAAALKARDGHLDLATRKALALEAFSHTAEYDAAIAGFFARTLADGEPVAELPETITLPLKLVKPLRYGENPHQRAGLYRQDDVADGSLAGAELKQGKALSFNNIADANAAYLAVQAFDDTACVIVKHANPCGVALSPEPLEAYTRARACDPTSAFGGIIAFNCVLDRATAEAIISRQFVEVIVCPEVSPGAAEVLAAKPDVRVLVTGRLDSEHPFLDIRTIDGGFLVQDADLAHAERSLRQDRVVTQRAPTAAEQADLMFAWQVAAAVKSNAIVYARDKATVGIGAGQMSRVVSARIAGMKAADEGLEVPGAVMASDAFFPFRDGIDAAAEAGIRAVIQPGGSKRDDEVIAAADEHDIAMIFTGVRHFRH